MNRAATHCLAALRMFCRPRRKPKPALCPECGDTGYTRADQAHCTCPVGQRIYADSIGADYEPEAGHVYGRSRKC